MARKLKKSRIVLPGHEEPAQIGLFTEERQFDPFPTVNNSIETIRRILYERSGPIGLDLEYDQVRPGVYKPSILGLAANDICGAVRWEEALAKEVVDIALKSNRLLVGHSVVGADRPVLYEATSLETPLEAWGDSMLTHFLANQDFAKTTFKEEEDGDSGSLGFMNLWTAASMALSVPNWKRCRGRTCSHFICPTHDVFGYCAVDSWAGLQIYLSNLRELEQFGVPPSVVQMMMEDALICHEMEEQGIAVDRELVKRLREEMKKHKDAIFDYTLGPKGEKIFTTFNPASPAQVIDWFLNNPVVIGGSKYIIRLEKSDKRNVYRELEKWAERLAFSSVQELIEFEGDLQPPLEELLKLYEFKDSGKGPDPWFADKYFRADGLIHPRFIATGASSTRLASSKPNFQNIGKRGWAKRLKQCIIPRHKDLCFVESDSSQLELRDVLWQAGVSTAVANTIFEDLVVKSDGAFARAAEMGKMTPRDVAKSIVHACVDETHQILTRNGWVPISEWSGEEICQWDTSGELSFTTPLKFHKYHINEEVFEIDGPVLSLRCTQNHQTPSVVATSGFEKWHRTTFSEIPSSARIPTSGVLKDEIEIYDDMEIKRAVAIQADSTKYGNHYIFHVVKERKKARLRELFPNFEQKPCSCHPARGSRCGGYFKTPLLDEKKFTAELLNLSQRQRLLFLEELMRWDGSSHFRNGARIRAYSSTVQENVEWVQTIAHLAGKQTRVRCRIDRRGNRKPLWTISINDRVFTSTWETRVENYAGTVYCFTVPTGYFLIRRNNKIFITGNSNYLESIQIYTETDLKRPNIKKEIELGAIHLYPDWNYGGGVVGFNGVNLAQRLFGDKTYENRQMALQLRKYYVDLVPAIRKWHMEKLRFIEKFGYAQLPTGHFLRLRGNARDNAKIGIGFLGQGTGAQYIRGVMRQYKKIHNVIPVLNVHDSLVFERPASITDRQALDFMSLMYEEIPEMPGFKAPGAATRGRNYGELEKIKVS